MKPHRVVPLLSTAMLIDALGSGVFAPFVLLYGHAVVGLPLTVTGLVLTLAGGAAVVAGPAAGAVVDRVGPARVVVASNLAAAVSAFALLVVHGPVGYGLSALVAAAAQRVFWAAFAPLVADTVEEHRRETFFGWMRAFRYGGITGGAALAAGALRLGTERGLHAVVTADGVSYLVAAALILTAYAGRRVPHIRQPARRATTGGYRAVLADRGNVALFALNISCTLSCTVPSLALAVYVLDALHGANWLPGLLAGVIAIGLTATTAIVARAGRGRNRLTLLRTVNLGWALAVGLLGAAGVAAWPTVPLLLAGALLLGVAEGAYAPIADAIPLVIAPTGLAGRYTALHQLAWGVSGTIAPLFTALLLDLGRFPLWIAMAALTLLTATGYAVLHPRLASRVGRIGGPARPAEPTTA